MDIKLDYYDLMCSFVPGTLLIGFVAVAFPDLTTYFRTSSIPEAFTVLSLVVLAVFAGQTIQALSSAAEPVLSWSWGGRMSETVFTQGLGDRYMSAVEAKRIEKKLEQSADTKLGPVSSFNYAQSIASDVESSRIDRFNALYGYHRSLFMVAFFVLVVFFASSFLGAFRARSEPALWGMGIGLLALTFLLWYRTKQRSIYFVREVLLAAERTLESVEKVSSAT